VQHLRPLFSYLNHTQMQNLVCHALRGGCMFMCVFQAPAPNFEQKLLDADVKLSWQGLQDSVYTCARLTAQLSVI
jgi:hypothetical protein